MSNGDHIGTSFGVSAMSLATALLCLLSSPSTNYLLISDDDEGC